MTAFPAIQKLGSPERNVCAPENGRYSLGRLNLDRHDRARFAVARQTVDELGPLLRIGEASARCKSSVDGFKITDLAVLNDNAG
jgi:hypothetical protein